MRGLVRPLSGWIADFLDSVFNWDGRLPRTMWPLLFRPGFLTLEYVAGRRIRYVTPVRLFLFLTLLLFIAVRLSGQLGVGGSVGQVAPPAEDRSRIERLVEWLPEAPRREVLADALSPPAPPPNPVVEDDGGRIVVGDWDAGSEPVRIAWLPDAANAALDRAVARMVANLQRINREPERFVDELLALAPPVLFFMLPVFALLLKAVYLLRRRLYLEHLLVALHSHAFIAAALLLLVGLQALRQALVGLPLLPSLLGWAGIALLCWIPAYLLLMQKRVYGQGWGMTAFKYVLIGCVYLALLTVGILVTLLVGLLVF